MGLKVVLLGASLSSGNRGVNALTRGTINSILEFFNDENIEIQILSFNASKKFDNIISYKGKKVRTIELPVGIKQTFITLIKHNFRKVPERIESILTAADYIFDISEGDSFADIYGLKRYVMHSMLKKYAINKHLSIFLLPQTIGPFKNVFVRQNARKILRRVDHTFVRDSISLDFTINKLKVNRNKCSYIPDMAFFMTPSANVNLFDFLPEETAKNKNIIGINISGLLYNGGYTGKNMFDFKVSYKEVMNNIISHFIALKDTLVLLVPHVITEEMKVEDDLSTCLQVADKFRTKTDRIFSINMPLQEDELKTIISNCNFFIGGRMHACIGAVSTNVPTVPIAYSRKFQGIWDDLGLGECIADPRTQTKEEILRVVENSYNNRNKIIEQLEKKNKLIKSQILSMYNIITDHTNQQVK